MTKYLLSNYNKAQCKTCIFKTDGQQLELRPGRLEQIKASCLTKAVHLCHTTHKTCYGAMQWQADIFYKMGWIEAPTVESFLNAAQAALQPQETPYLDRLTQTPGQAQKSNK